MAITVTQATTTAKQTASGNGLALNAFGSAVTAGNTIIVAISHYSNAIPYVTDSSGNCYVLDARLYNASVMTNFGVAILRAVNVAGGTPTITVRNVASTAYTQFWAASAIETSPVNLSVQGTGNNATSATATAGALTTLAANSLVIGLAGTDSAGALTISTSGFTQFGTASGGTTETFDAEYQVYSSIQTGLNVTWTLSSVAWRALSCAYVAAPSSGGGVPLIGQGLVY